jgi:hypothetical protein
VTIKSRPSAGAKPSRNTTENLGDSTTGSSLYCVWVPVHDEGGDRLMSIWIDRVLTAFEAQVQAGTYETCTTVTDAGGGCRNRGYRRDAGTRRKKRNHETHC